MNTIKDEITKLADDATKRNATLTAEDLVEAARNARTYPLLNDVLWKVPEAELAAEARIARAHKLIIRCTVVTSEGSTVRAFLHTRNDKGYRPAEAIAGSTNLARIKLAELTADIGRARQRLASFKAIISSETADEIDDALGVAETRIRAASERATAAA